MTLLAEIVATSARVAETSKRNEKTAAIASLLRRLDAAEVEPVVAWLSGELRQGRIGIGWAAVRDATGDPAAAPSVQVLDLDRALSALAAIGGAGSQAERLQRLSDLRRATTADEWEFISRLLLGDLRQGALAGLVADAAAKAAGVPAAVLRRAAMLGGDLPRAVAAAMTGGTTTLAEIGLRPGVPVLPMLAATSPDVATALAEHGGLVSVEWKLDGARLQVHRLGDEVRLFTRGLHDVTERLPEVAEVGRALNVGAVVLDAEVIGLADTDDPERFQRTMAAFAQDDAEGRSLQLQPFFFDILHLNGEDLIDRPLRERREILDGVVGARIVPGIFTSSPEQAEAFAAGALAAGHEGVMVKAGESVYEAGRRGKSWRKVKPVVTFDLVVLAAEWGHGRRRDWLSNLHLGARDPQDQTRFVMVGKTFKGLTDALLAWQTEQLLARKVDQQGITVLVRPELVVEIAVDGVQISTRYPGGVALRFARVKQYRIDKQPGDADTIDAVRALL